MLKYIILALVAATLAAAQDDGADMAQKMGTDELSITEYIKEYFKITKEGHIREPTFTVKPEHVKVALFSSSESVVEGTLKDYEGMLRYPHFNTTLETKFFIHGWLQKKDPKLSKKLAMIYALRGKRVNFITVDWSEYSFSKDFYYVAREVVPKVAEYLHPLVQKVMEVQKNNRVHLVGFDMGAHIAGMTGKRIEGMKIARITGLSPAGRYYNDMLNDMRLAKGDAEYVDIIHTNMGGAGISQTIGNVDFLPNGGRQQPAVENKNHRAEKDVISHLLARNYFFESVELGYAGFIGKKCESYTSFLNQKCAFSESEIMGESVSKRVNGSVYMTVNKDMKPYYSKGIYGLYPYSESSYTTTTYATPSI